MPDSTSRNKLITIGSLLTFLLGWYGAAALVGKEIILPNPAVTLHRLVQLITTGGYLVPGPGRVYPLLPGRFNFRPPFRNKPEL